MPQYDLFDDLDATAIYAGVDEAGRGPLAGPVVAAAVVLDPGQAIVGLNDSKKLSEARRETLFEQIVTRARVFAIAEASVAEIDELNILAATMLAMRRAVTEVTVQIGTRAGQSSLERVHVDGNRCPQPLPCTCLAMVGGDARDPAIAAASILAKVTRDRLVCDLDREYPGYEFAKHKGYPTARHRALLIELGPCPAHRRSFGPVRKLLG